jgi:GNAT superfamily N-acetyltransferase
MALSRFRPDNATESRRQGGHDHPPVWVRLAHPSDAAALVPLCGQLGHACDADALRARLIEQETDPDYANWVAVDADGEVFGYASGHLVRTISLQAPMAHLTALVTDGQARGRGVGRSLIGAFDDWAEACSATEAVYNSDGRGHGTHRSLDAYGFARDGVRFAKIY